MALDTKKSTSLRDGYGQTYQDGGFADVNHKMADLVDSGVFKIASTVSVTSGSAQVSSGAMTIPGGSVITDFIVVATTATVNTSDTIGVQFGTGSDGYDITGKATNSILGTAATSLAAGRGITMYTQSSEPLGALISLPVNAHDTGLFFGTDTDIHGTVSSSAAGFASGAFTFVVKYTNII
jgi:hypothetical protein|tara:strand:+ start:905 stop:1447 length:543 start_codon:yes stop_codon:yes gene_type:complete